MTFSVLDVCRNIRVIKVEVADIDDGRIVITELPHLFPDLSCNSPLFGSIRRRLPHRYMQRKLGSRNVQSRGADTEMFRVARMSLGADL